MRNALKEFVLNLDSATKNKKIKVISHYDTDGITSAAIMSRCLFRWKKEFSIEIVKGLDEEFIKKLPENEVLLFLDLASNSFSYLANKKTEIFILDHHEITQNIPNNVKIINPLMFKHDPISGAGICYLFAKEVLKENRDLANLAVIGMVGDMLEKDISKTYDEILQDSDCEVRQGLLLYPSTRPLDRALEYSSSMYIPGVTGNYKGVLELLKDSNIQRNNGQFKPLYELTQEEMSALTTAIMLRVKDESSMQKMIGNLYLVKFLSKKEDAREISALINACSRMDKPYVALGFCLGNRQFKEQAEKIYIEYKQHLVAALRHVEEMNKISGKNYTIINAKNNIKDTIIGTVASIISHSPAYPEGTMIIALAYNEDKIKVSARLSGREGRNVREVLAQVMTTLGGEVGGHPKAAGCLISKENEDKFISELQKVLDIEFVKA